MYQLICRKNENYPYSVLADGNKYSFAELIRLMEYFSVIINGEFSVINTDDWNEKCENK